MTLEQAIDRYTNNAEYERIHGSLQGCLDFRQLAEWLKDYKRLLEQQPCEMTTEEYRQRMIQAFHNADTDELIAVCVLPTEKEFEHLEWLLKNHYKKAPCVDAISREAAITIAGTHTLTVDETVKALEQLPSVTPKPIECDDAISRDAALEKMADYAASGYADSAEDFEEYSRIICQLPSVTQKYGKWIIIDDCEQFIAKCSECGRIEDSRMISKYPYCRCGAKMQERSDKE